MIPSSLVFVYTYKCNFNCIHCSLSCKPANNDVIWEEIVYKVIDQAYYIPSIKLIVFTGGEPLLYKERIVNHIKYATTKGFYTRLVTNGWWARNIDTTEKYLQELVDSGLKEINISFDDFHFNYLKNFGGINNLFNIVEISKNFGLTPLIGTIIYPGSKINVGYLKKALKEKNLLEGVQFMEDYLFPLGRARKKCSIDMFIPGNNKEVFQPCREAGKALTVLPDGNITFCCGHILNTKAQDLITIANIIRDNITLSQIIDRMQRNVLFWLLYLEGPLSIFNRLDISHPVYRKCEACYLLATKYLRQLHKLADHKEAIWQEVKEEKINVISA